MDKLAYIGSNFSIYWNSVILTLAAATAVCFFLCFYLHKTGNAAAGFAVVPLSILLSIVFARFFHWYCRDDSYGSFLAAMTDYTSGGYALMGVFLGCFLAAVILRLCRLHDSLPGMMDCMSIAGCAGIAVGRLASLFNSSDRGAVLANLKSLPFAWPVANAVSGELEYRLATFMIQAMVAAVIFLGLVIFYFYGVGRRDRKDGDVTLMFALCYGVSQVVLDSTRYDSLFFRSNGFVSIVQVLGAVALAVVIVIFSIRLVKAGGFKFWYIPLFWLPLAALIGVAGFMEYYVQRHGSEAMFAYSVMTGCLLAVIIITLLIRIQALEEAEKRS